MGGCRKLLSPRLVFVLSHSVHSVTFSRPPKSHLQIQSTWQYWDHKAVYQVLSITVGKQHSTEREIRTGRVGSGFAFPKMSVQTSFYFDAKQWKWQTAVRASGHWDADGRSILFHLLHFAETHSLNCNTHKICQLVSTKYISVSFLS